MVCKTTFVVHLGGVESSAVLTSTPSRKEPTMYTLQSDSHGNLIICKGDTVRNGYRIIERGAYADLLVAKARIILAR